MTSESERLFVAVMLNGGVLSEQSLAPLLSQSATLPDAELSELLIRQGELDAKERDEFQQRLERRLVEQPGRAGEIVSELLRRAVRDALGKVSDPSIRRFLEGRPIVVGGFGDAHFESSFVPIRMHAKGGIGEVWLAEDVALKREVALKRILPQHERNDRLVRRFNQEATITAQLQHPNIVPVYGFHPREDGCDAFYAMKFIRGNALSEVVSEASLLDEGGRFNPVELNRLVGVCIEVADAISYAHSQQVIHRDLKPENVIVGDFGEVLVVDWGLAKRAKAPKSDGGGTPESLDDLADERTLAGTVLGSPLYMAPEQAAGRIGDIDARTDVYGLGAILFTILCGRPPHAEHSGSTIREHLQIVAKSPTPRARAIRPNVSPSLDAVCAKAMAPKPGDRYPSAEAFVHDLRRWQAGEPVDAYREPLLRRIVRWSIRHPSWTIAIALLFFVASVGPAMLLTYTLLSRDARIDRLLSYLNDDDSFIASEISFRYQQMVSATRYLARSSLAERMLKQAATDASQLDQTTFEDLTSWLRDHGSVTSVYMLDDAGRPLLQVVRNNSLNDKPRIVPPTLPPNANETILEPLAKLSAKRVFISEPRFERRPDGSFAPVVVFTTRVWNAKTGERLGTLLVTAPFSRLFLGPKKDEFPKTSHASEISVATPDGKLLAMISENQVVSLGREEGLKMLENWEELAPTFEGNRSANRMGVRYTSKSGEVVYARKARFDPNNADRFLVIVASTPFSTIVQQQRVQALSMAPAFVLSFFVACLIAVLILLCFKQLATAKLS
ncbi:Serine/threonine-protein kinase PknD [Planctomycetes bacterium Pan216]|uniref:Serine/threonine-protein kinase PknD n=1 Tax=Kolteria novifilia TaxID=2527975 RepID=A0A518B4R9_9BACT|nr:Serine/threonine-protein kinase PknD [Planctomycetes bacterium Pan216]